MSLNGILTLLESHPEFIRGIESIRQGQNGKTEKPSPHPAPRHPAPQHPADAQTYAVRPSARPAFIAALYRQRLTQPPGAPPPCPLLVITPRQDDARRLHSQLLAWLGDDAPALFLPEPEILPFERLAVDAPTANQRLAALAALAAARPDPAPQTQPGNAPPPLIICSISSALLYTAPPELMTGRLPQPLKPAQNHTEPDKNHPKPNKNYPKPNENHHKPNENHPELVEGWAPPSQWRVGDRVRIDSILSQWQQLGYRHEPVVESPGAFSHRGGILDIYPPNCELPLRIELFDDEIDTIRQFDPLTQRSIAPADEVRPIPAREQLPSLAIPQGPTAPETPDAIARRMDFSRCNPAVRERIQEELETLPYTDNPEILSFYRGLLNRASLLDYLPPNAAILLERGSRVADEASELEERIARMRAAREERGELPANFPSPCLPWADFAARLAQLHPVDLQTWAGDDDDPVFRPATPYYGRLEQLSADLKRRQGQGAALVAVSQHARRVAEILEQQGIAAPVLDRLDAPPSPGQVCIVSGALPGGWAVELPPSPSAKERKRGVKNPVSALDLLTDAELFGSVKERRQRRPRRAERGPDVSLADLEPGTFVVHIDHGVARFAGTTLMNPSDGSAPDKEYLVLEYAENDKLYVPTDHLNRVSAYVGAQEHAPALTRLGAADWARIKQRVKGAAREMAQELIRTNAARQLAKGHEFSPDTAWQQELEDSFPYIETPDQAQAITDVKSDMERERPMDRLICGDVGYGKTEVALRAAFKTVSDGMQVGILVPTTVLAQQHYATFTDRLSPFPVRVEVLSRFRTPKEQQQVIAGLQSGEIDIVIGTHRLLQKDVRFKNLGLAVVDEEQRFGVSHKERLKQLRRQVDVLTLSATPIPRTLNMALSGLRDLSSMSSAPEERLPVKTFVSEYSDDVIKEAILRELERDGQVFYLHNRVRSIGQAAEKIKELVPHARVMIGHGQMAEQDLEEVMLDFANEKADVLVCTTIIESGLDLPNVNTLIIERADRFGLAQLYQLRGRVGRGRHRAYAYLLTPRFASLLSADKADGKAAAPPPPIAERETRPRRGRKSRAALSRRRGGMTEAAEMRLQAILEASDLGAGFRIAMRDLEIRGAGNVLGADQSGHIQEVGLDLYTQLLQEAVRELEREQGSETGDLAPAPSDDPPRIELPLPAGIPDDYISHLPTRLSVYQRLAKLAQRRELPEIREELRDRFGPVPDEVEALLKVAEIRAIANAAGAESVIQTADAIVISLRNPVGGAKAPLQRALGPAAQVGNSQIQMPLRPLGDQWQQRLTRTLERLQVFMDNMRQLAANAAQN